MKKIVITKPINTELLIDQLNTAYALSTPFWLYQDANELSVQIPDILDVALAQTVLNNHVAADLSAAQTLRNSIVAIAQTAVEVKLINLTAAQIKALMALVLYNQGGVSAMLTVKPLTTWVSLR